MSVIEESWARVRAKTEVAGAIRVDPEHPADLFAAQDEEGRLGLVLLLTERPPSPPRLDSVIIDVTERSDGRWAVGLWLMTQTLLTPFAQLCDDLIASSRDIPGERMGSFVVGRLHRWHELLESASRGWSLSRLRGLIGELLVLKEGIRSYGQTEMIRGWGGPFGAPQDFTLPELWLEVKATFPTARSVRITSVEQLSAPGRLLLAVYTLATLLPSETGVTARALVTEIEADARKVNLDDVADDFNRRLNALGFDRTADYAQLPFRLDAVHYYEVSEGFPRITPADIASGIGDVTYDVELGALKPFETSSPMLSANGPR
jgi:hypothetical protein